jgi:hypothetical protein
LLLQACNDEQQICETVPGSTEQQCYMLSDFGNSTLAQTTPEPPGDNCPGGGKRVDTGFDDNDNGVLDALEIDATVYICDGAAGPTGAPGPVGDAGPRGLRAITAMYAEDPGDVCASGGVRVEYGVDANEDDALQPEEVEGIRFVCDGEDPERREQPEPRAMTGPASRSVMKTSSTAASKPVTFRDGPRTISSPWTPCHRSTTRSRPFSPSRRRRVRRRRSVSSSTSQTCLART